MTSTRYVPRARGLALIGIVLAASLALHCPASARADEWVQRSCSVGSEYIAPEGWEGIDNHGYTAQPLDNCERFYNGGGLRADIAPGAGAPLLAGETWTYRPPSGSAIAGGTLSVNMTAREGFALIAANVKGATVQLAKCESPGCFHDTKDVPITAAGASEIYEQAACLGSEGVCHAPGSSFAHEGDGAFSAEAEISSAQVLLSTTAVPSAFGFDGTLLSGTASGVVALGFTATDPGPGVYEARIKIDGTVVWTQTPNLNEGKCVSAGSSEGARAFNYAQPCPRETPVDADINTAAITDGTHALTVEVEDAAGDTATVYTGTVTTVNPHATTVLVPSALPPERGPANGSPASEHAVLVASAREPLTFTRTLRGSAQTLTGHLTATDGTPIKGANLQLLAQTTSSSAPLRIAVATTGSDGAWTLLVPAGPSRLLRVVYYSHLLDTAPAAALDFHERVHAALSIRAPHTARLGRPITFSGGLAGGYVPPDGESIEVEIRYGGRWRTIEVLPSDRHGHWAYRYVFSLGTGSSYLFRAATLPNAGYPFLATSSNTVRVTVAP